MQKILILVMLLALMFPGSAQKIEPEKIYVGTFTSEGAEGIYLCDFDNSSGKMSVVSTFKGIDNPSFLKISPDKQNLYAVTRPPAAIEASGGYVNAYRIEKNGSLRFLNKQISNGADPCHVDVSPDGKYVAIATYGGGSTSLYPVSESGSLKPASSVIFNKGAGPTPRQQAPHAHSIKFSKDGKQAFSAPIILLFLKLTLKTGYPNLQEMNYTFRIRYASNSFELNQLNLVLISLINSSRVAFFWKAPVKSDVVVMECCF